MALVGFALSLGPVSAKGSSIAFHKALHHRSLGVRVCILIELLKEGIDVAVLLLFVVVVVVDNFKLVPVYGFLEGGGVSLGTSGLCRISHDDSWSRGTASLRKTTLRLGSSRCTRSSGWSSRDVRAFRG